MDAAAGCRWSGVLRERLADGSPPQTGSNATPCGWARPAVIETGK
jgi:hypothetical protein